VKEGQGGSAGATARVGATDGQHVLSADAEGWFRRRGWSSVGGRVVSTGRVVEGASERGVICVGPGPVGLRSTVDFSNGSTEAVGKRPRIEAVRVHPSDRTETGIWRRVVRLVRAGPARTPRSEPGVPVGPPDAPRSSKAHPRPPTSRHTRSSPSSEGWVPELEVLPARMLELCQHGCLRLCPHGCLGLPAQNA